MFNGRLPNPIMINKTPLQRLHIGATKADGTRVDVTLVHDPATGDLVAQDWLTTKQAAQDLGVDRTHAARLVREGRLEGVKVGPDWLISRASISTYLETKAPSGRPAAHLQTEEHNANLA